MYEHWDIASGETKTNDYTAGVHMHLLNDNKTILINDLVHGQYGKETKNKLINTAHKDGVNTRIIIETGVAAAGKLLYQELNRPTSWLFCKTSPTNY